MGRAKVERRSCLGLACLLVPWGQKFRQARGPGMQSLAHAIAILEDMLALVGPASVWARSKAALSVRREAKAKGPRAKAKGTSIMTRVCPRVWIKKGAGTQARSPHLQALR